ncbi:uncharacterized protein LOC128890568 [Hylaeus anthracinus]|uniref:uncharacterized protein LOC128890568 n=1 Tax=Hylaeus anthracinus TaxID=313031 RepID=UPI0023BA1092|nr:uncharacterized protein LOC128890568 [Hylaeus anthracinus]
MSVRTYVGLITPTASNCSYSWLMHRRTHLETRTQTATPKLALETPSPALQSTRSHSRRRIMMFPTSTDSRCMRTFQAGRGDHASGSSRTVQTLQWRSTSREVEMTHMTTALKQI